MALISNGRPLEGDMGASFGSIHIRSEDAAFVRVALEAIASETQQRFLVAPPIRGWTTVFPNHSGQDWKVSEALASRIPANVLHCLVHDDDIFAYRLYQDGSLVDEYDSAPGYFETVGPRDRPPKGGNVDLLRAFLEKPDKLAELRSTLARAREVGDFEQFRLDRFAKLLGLPNACSSYEYLQAGERDGIRGWKKFVHIPDRSGAKAARRAAAARLRAELKRLQREQVLLLDEVQDKGANQLSGPEPVWANNPAKPEVLTVWSDPFDFTAADTEWWRCAPPEWKPQSIDLTTSPKADRAMFSRTGRWLVISNVDSERSVEIWDWPMRTKQSEFAFERYLSAIVFSPDESSLLAVYQNKLRSISLADGTSMGVRPLLCRDCRSLAVHPDGDWLALNYDGMLGLADVRAPDPVLLFGIGGLLDYGPMMAQMFNEAELERMIGELANVLPSDKLEQYRRDLLRQVQQSCYRGKEAVTCLQFSSDGRWLICGTQEGVRVFAWDRLKSSREAGPTPDLAADTDEKIADEADEREVGGRRVYAVALDETRQRVPFGGLGGKVRFLDLESGLSGDLLTIPDGLSVRELAVSSDRSALLLTRMPVNLDNKGRSRFQIWSYPRLCAFAGIPH